MKFLKSWLQDCIVEKLPEDEVIVDALNKKAFEVEEIIQLEDDTVFDIKVLPNRAHDALGHIGMSRELCADLGLTFKEGSIKELTDANKFLGKENKIETKIENNGCSRFMTMRIDGVKVEDSPAWLKNRLEAIGQRSINNIVDATNLVMFSLNKPMHAYDTREVSGYISARLSKNGEKLLTLDDKELMLDESTLVIADSEKVLGLAGIKGGKYSGIKDDTTSIILESANFHPTLIRKTSEKYGYKTDATKRFENGIANSLVSDGLYMTANLIKELFPNAVCGEVTDVYPNKDTPYYVGVTLSELNRILGTSYSDDEIVGTLNKLSFSYEKIIPENYIKELYPTLIGKAYKNPSSMRYDAPEAFSCSSLVSYLYKGIWMPSISVDKYIFAEKIKKDSLKFGDLVFANSGEGRIYFESVEFLRGTKVPDGIDHLAMYVGDEKVIHATKVEGKVITENLEDFSKTRKVVGYGRVTDDLQEEVYVISVPPTRLDIRIKEDLVEEVGRIIGYEKITPTLPKLNRVGIPHKRMYYENKIREILGGHGFSEVITYTFGDEGEVEIVKGLADDKEKLRTNLGNEIRMSLSRNLHNSPLLGQKTMKIFEFGNVFTKNAETRHFALALDDGGKKSNFTEETDMILSEIKRTLQGKEIEYETVSTKPYCIELDFDTLITSLPEPTTYETPSFLSLPVISYKSVSPYPFIVRDIAVWVNDSATWEDIYGLCISIENKLVVRIDLFDTFAKEIDGVKRISYAFRLVFQSYDKTLTDDEVNSMMEKYYEVFKEKGYEIR